MVNSKVILNHSIEIQKKLIQTTIDWTMINMILKAMTWIKGINRGNLQTYIKAFRLKKKCFILYKPNKNN